MKWAGSIINNEKGQSLIELMIAMAVFVFAVTAISWLALNVYLADKSGREMMAASFLAKEGLEAAKSIRDNNWSDLANGNHGLAISENHWVFQGAQEDISSKLNNGVRNVAVEEIDSNRKKIISNVSWNFNSLRQGSVSLVTYMTNWLLVAIGDWSNPFQEAFLNLSGVQDGLKVQVLGNYAYLVRNDGTPDFAVIDITNPASPQIAGSLSLPGAPTNIFVSGNYAYISSANSSQELQVVNITNPTSPSIIGTFNAPGAANGQGVYFSGNTAYLARGSSAAREFFIIDVSSPSLPNLIGSLDLASPGNELLIIGNFAYIASGHNSQELQIIDITIPASPVLAGSLNLSGASDGISIAGFGNTVVLGRADGFLYLLDVSVPDSPSIIGSFNAGGDINDISIGNNNKYAFLATAAGSAEFRVVDISNLAAPVSVGILDFPAVLSGIAYYAAKDRAVAVGMSNTAEFIVIMPF